MTQPIKISECEYVTDVAKFTTVYLERSKENTPLILKAGVVERYELLKQTNYDNNTTTESKVRQSY